MGSNWVHLICYILLLTKYLQLFEQGMSLAVFSTKNLYHRNGIWWWSKMMNRVLGEDRYDAFRVYRRVLSNKFYYYRQELLYRCFVETPDIANLLGIYPKVDSSHGFGYHNTYEMYRDFQQNTINSDGSFAMWIAYIAFFYTVHATYSYFLPWYWNKTAPCKNGEEQRNRMRDVLASTIVEETIGMQWAEWGWTPHDYHSIRRRMSEGLSHPDDVRAMAMTCLNRKHRYIEHYRHHIGNDQTKMIAP